MITKVVNVAPPGAYWSDLEINLSAGPDDLLELRKIDGLEPVVANVNTAEFGNLDGEFFNGSHVGKRNIVFTFGLNTKTGRVSVDAARQQLYFYFPNRDGRMTLRFEFDNRDPVQIDGYMESIQGDRFVEDPELQVSIICPKPNFLIVPSIWVNGVTGDSNDEAAPYEGSATGGLVFELNAGSGGYSGDVYLESKVTGTSDWSSMHFSDIVLPANSKLRVNTHQGTKSAWIIPASGAMTSAIKYLEAIWYWKTLNAAVWRFRVRTPGDGGSRGWDMWYFNQEIGV